MKNIAIIGTAAAGISAAKAVKKNDDSCKVQVFTHEKENPYYRPYLTEYLWDTNVTSKSNFYLNPENWYEENGIKLYKETKIVKIDKENKLLIDSNDNSYSYDKLIIATGANPFVPIPGAIEKDFVFTVRSLEDAKIAETFSRNIKKAVVVGGGLLGLEAAWSLCRKGIKTTVIELSDRLLPIQLDKESSSFIKNAITSKGVEVFCNAATESIDSEGEKNFVTLKDGTKIETEMVLVSIGVRAEISLAKESGIAVGRGIVVNDKMETSAEGIYACGDCAEVIGCPPLWMPASKQGTVAGTNAAGGEVRFEPAVYPAALNAFETKLMSVGIISGDGVYDFSKTDDTSIKKLFFKDGKTVGAIVINDSAASAKILNAVKTSETEENSKKII
ncbi:MAG: NAD(P)/FAD-dependent oxidoreductase [bacterium]